MKLLTAIKKIKEEGYENVKVVHASELPDWQYLTYQIKLFSIDAELQLEVDDGTEHTIKKGKFYEIAASTFYKVTTDSKTAKYIIASFPAVKLYGT
jgi:hypothetical protein